MPSQISTLKTQTKLDTPRLREMANFFERSYIVPGKLPNMALLISQGGEVAYESYRGQTAYEGGQPIAPDTLFRIYSMTKPITVVAAMILFEEGQFRLDMPVSRFIPEFAETEVWVGGDADNYQTRKPDREITIHDLFTHMSGLTYGFLYQTGVDEIYRSEKIGERRETLADMCARLARLPLVHSPGQAWNYGHSTDVLGRIIEIISRESLDVFLKERIFEPLDMVDTGFYAPPDKVHRLAACYMNDPISRDLSLTDGAGAASAAYCEPPMLLNAGGGLVSTLRDYHRFCLMLLRGGSLEGERILGPKTIEFMRMNHLPGGHTIKELGDKTFSEARMDGNGFCLLGSVTTDVAATLSPGSIGNYGWGGLASTFFWIDPVEELIVIQATQMIPSGRYPIRPQLFQHVYAALT